VDVAAVVAVAPLAQAEELAAPPAARDRSPAGGLREAAAAVIAGRR
jgi:hypothetical protein